jgi:hypothetical protein
LFQVQPPPQRLVRIGRSGWRLVLHYWGTLATLISSSRKCTVSALAVHGMLRDRHQPIGADMAVVLLAHKDVQQPEAMNGHRDRPVRSANPWRKPLPPSHQALTSLQKGEHTSAQ